MGYGAVRRLRNVTIALIFLAGAPVAAEPVTVVALGDSLTAGYGLPEGEGLVPQLQGWLAAQGADAVVVNAGVSGDTTAGGLARLDWALTPEADALIVTLGGNDMLRGLPPAEARANLDGILKAAKAKALPVLLVAMKAPANWGPDYKAEFDAMYPALAAQYQTLLLDDFFAGLAAAGADPANPASMARWLQADGLHPTRDGVAEIVKALGPKVLELVAQAGG